MRFPLIFDTSARIAQEGRNPGSLLDPSGQFSAGIVGEEAHA